MTDPAATGASLLAKSCAAGPPGGGQPCHTRDARAHGETEERLYLLDAWRESPLYTERERAALVWTETLTQIRDTRAPDDVYE